MIKLKSEVLDLIQTYKEKNDTEILKEIIQKALFEKFEPLEYFELYKIKNMALKNIIILKAPIEVVIKIIESESENCNFYIIEKRLKKNTDSMEADKLIDVELDEIKSLAAKYASKEKLIDKLLSETKGELFHENFESIKKEQVVKKIFDNLKKYELTESEADRLIYSDYYQVRNYAMEYASKDGLIEKLIKEKNYSIVDEIIDKLKGYNFSEIEGDKLLFAKSEKVVILAIKYASKDKLIEKLLDTKTYGNIIKKIFFVLKDYEFSETEIDKLLNADSYKVRALITEYASSEKLIKRLLIEDDTDVIQYIFYELRDYNFSEVEANELINANHHWTRRHMVKYASEEKLLERLFVETNEGVIHNILLRIKNYYFIKSKADKLLEAESYKVRLYMVKYASLSKLRERLLIEENDEVVKEIFLRLELYNFSKKEIQKFVYAKNYNVRAYAINYASEEVLIEMLMVEDTNNVIFKIFSRLKEYVFSEEQVNNLINAKDSNVREFIINYASKQKLIERLFVENNATVSLKIGQAIKNYELTQEEANKLLDSKSFEVRIYAVKYASKEKIFERLKIETRKEVVDELIVYILKYASKNELIEQLAYVNDLSVITSILNVLY